MTRPDVALRLRPAVGHLTPSGPAVHLSRYLIGQNCLKQVLDRFYSNRSFTETLFIVDMVTFSIRSQHRVFSLNS